MFELQNLNKENAKIDLFKLLEIAKKSALIGSEILLKNYNKIQNIKKAFPRYSWKKWVKDWDEFIQNV